MSSICLVCNDNNAKHHYGTVCCPSCKGFFRRVYLSAKNLECYRGNCCEITRGKRNSCRACRYKKCLDVGMNVNDIRGRADPKSPVPLPEFDDDMGDPSEDSSSNIALPMEMSLNLPSEFSAADQAEQLSNLYINLDRFCESTSMTPSEISQFDEDALINRMLDSTVLQLVRKTGPQCPRFLRSWKPVQFVDVTNFRRSWARDVVNMLDWANHFPAFRKLSEEDKVKVFISRFTQFSLLTKCYRTYREGCSGLVFGCGNVFPYEKDARTNVAENSLRTMLSKVSDALFPEVVFPMAQLGMTDQDYVLIKANLFLFEGFSYTSLSEDGKMIISSEKGRHRSAMLAHMTARNEGFDENLNRIVQTENMMTSIEAVANYMDKEIQYMQLFGLASTNNQLMKECHTEKYKMDLSFV